jgi:GntR family transcriptional regulator/MocR family aminotransferase
MRIPLDRNSAVPLYQQIVNWLRDNIRSGSLPVNTRLPASRALSDELGVSRITVLNAYSALESEGLIISRLNSGVFVAPLAAAPRQADDLKEMHWPLWQLETAGEAELAAAPATVPHSRCPNPVSFTGVGDPRQFPLKEFEMTMRDVLRRDGITALEYGPFDSGYLPLRETIAHVLASQGIQSHPGEALITSGSQQALALICQVLLKTGDTVLVEKPTYNLALELFQAAGVKIIGVPVDEFGMQVDLLEPLLQQHHPKLIYTIPNFQNPSGVCMSTARRGQLLALAERYNCPIIEDDFAGDLRYEGRAQPAIKALDKGGTVIYVGTFSKMLMPGLRIGYLLAKGPILAKLTRQKKVSDLTTSPLMQRVLDRYVTVGRYQVYLRRSIRLYRNRRDVMLAAIRAHLPECAVSTPQGGLFVWLKLPEGMSSSQLLPLAQEMGVEFAPGRRFFANPIEGEAYIRLNFAACTPEEIDLGICRLRDALTV